MKSALLLALATSAFARTFTVRNECKYTIWPAVFTDLHVNTPSTTPNIETGWEAPAGSVRTFTIPEHWRAGRIWGRRNCDFSNNPGPNSCTDGGCNGGLQCDPRSGTGVPPATVAEWTLGDENGLDWYDVSLVDGYNLPMKISTNVDCEIAECAADLGPDCPGPLKASIDSNGVSQACKSACSANLDGNRANSANCCSGQYKTPETCPPSGVQYYWYFKDQCKRSYVYAFDELSKTALWTCDASKQADYTLTFCP